MPPDPSSTNQPRGLAPLTAASRQRLQKVFEHGQRCVAKQDHDYANKLLAQCVVEDPGNLIYLQHFLANLQSKYGDNRKGSRLGRLKIKNHRSALNKAVAKGDWPAAFQAACAALALNPWDIPSLLSLASAYEELDCNECELYTLRCALTVDSKDVPTNRQAGLALERMGHFDQAIACWQRVKLALPADDQARQAVARLSVEQTIDKGGYDPASLGSSPDGLPPAEVSLARLAKTTGENDDLPPEARLRAALAAEPTESEHYIQLTDLLMREKRFDEAEQLLGEAASACGSGDMQIRERQEDIGLRRVAHQAAIAEQRHALDPTPESEQLAHRFRVQLNQVELETYAARAERDPGNLRLKYELALRLKRAGKIKEAISNFQTARADSKRNVAVLVELGECFQHIEQYKLALTHYEQAVDACGDSDSEIYRKALYRAAVLATGMREFDRAERHLTTLAALDYGYRDVADRLDKIGGLRDNG